jgi:hypothetical protein
MENERVKNDWLRDRRSVAEIAETQGRGQFDFAHVVSTNYSQYHIWWLLKCGDKVKHAQIPGLQSSSADRGS